MRKLIIFYMVAQYLLLSSIACSTATAPVKPADNSTYTMEDIITIAQKHDPDCRKFAAVSENGTPSG